MENEKDNVRKDGQVEKAFETHEVCDKIAQWSDYWRWRWKKSTNFSIQSHCGDGEMRGDNGKPYEPEGSLALRRRNDFYDNNNVKV